MAVARLWYLSTNCTLTFGSSNCRLLIFFPEWNQSDFSWGWLEKRRTRHFESKVKAIYGTLPSCDVFSVLHLNCLIFRQICALTPDILFPSPPTQRSSWLMRSVFAIRRDTPVDSKVYYHPVFALRQCAQIIDRHNFFLLTTRAPQSNLDYNLGQNRIERQTPIPNQGQSRTKPRKSPYGPFFSILGG